MFYLGGSQLNQSTISLEEFIHILKRRIWIVFIVGLIGLTLSSALTFLVIKPNYEATTQLLINKTEKNVSSNVYQETQADLQLMNTYIAVAKSEVILADVIKQLSLNMDLQQLGEKLNVSSEENSKVMDIHIRTNDPIESVKIANKIAETFKQQAPTLLDVKDVQVLSSANLQNTLEPVSPNTILNLLLGFFLGVIIGVAVVLLLELNDDRFKSEKEVEQYLELPVIGTIHKLTPVQQKKMRQQVVEKKQWKWLKDLDTNFKLWRNKG